MAVQEVRGDNGDSELADDYTFFYGNVIHHLEEVK
jgi:hypothetical protein